MFNHKSTSNTCCLARYFSFTVMALMAMALPSAQVNAQTTQAAKSKQSAASRAQAKTAAPIDIAINKAERLVMLSQRAAKLYAQGALGISVARSDIQLGDTITQFENDLAWLKNNAPAPAIAASSLSD
jgi:hypothetical protein